MSLDSGDPGCTQSLHLLLRDDDWSIDHNTKTIKLIFCIFFNFHHLTNKHENKMIMQISIYNGLLVASFIITSYPQMGILFIYSEASE
jgi:hypothetical protein